MTTPQDPNSSRRFLQTRQKKWAQNAGRFLSNSGITPNSISVTSMAFAGLAAYSYVHRNSFSAQWIFVILAIAGIQFRLLCNMFDGLVALEGGKKTATGDLFNEVPDRVADALILAAVGYASGDCPNAKEYAFVAALLAVATAYVRCLGASILGKHYFLGPMAKQHRMAMLTALTLLSLAEDPLNLSRGTFLYYGIIIMNYGMIATIYRRLSRIASEMRART